jgi:carbon monoxide dehydrogenase subunit G
MEMSSTRNVPAPPERVWQALNDPDTLKASIPGCESFERVGEDAYRATVAAKVGPVSARFTGNLRLADIDAPNGYTLKFEGQGGAAGFANGEAKVALAPGPDNGTALSYAVKAQVGGKLAQIGSRLVDGAAAKLADDFFARFVEQVGGPAEVAAVETPVAADEAPSGRRWVRVLAIGVIIAILIYLYASGR